MGSLVGPPRAARSSEDVFMMVCAYRLEVEFEFGVSMTTFFIEEYKNDC